jgi:hypothetical protein
MTEGPGALGHVFWIGGSPCSGKSTIVEMLAARHTFVQYNCDDALPRHMAQAIPASQPTLHRLAHMTWDEIWMRPVEALLADVLAAYAEEFPLILDELRALPADLPIVAEGAALMPALVHPVLARRSQGIWVVPSDAFQRAQYPVRGEWVQGILSQCAEPERAFQNWMDRDAAFARRIAREAEDIGLYVLPVDGTRTIAENAAAVMSHFGWDHGRNER